MKGRLLLAIGLAALAIGSSAIAARAYEREIGYYAPDGTLNGTAHYPCDGAPLYDGVLVGEQRVIFMEPCACTLDDCDHWP